MFTCAAIVSYTTVHNQLLHFLFFSFFILKPQNSQYRSILLQWNENLTSIPDLYQLLVREIAPSQNFISIIKYVCLWSFPPSNTSDSSRPLDLLVTVNCAPIEGWPLTWTCDFNHRSIQGMNKNFESSRKSKVCATWDHSNHLTITRSSNFPCEH